MNEIRNLIIGVDLGRSRTQICYFDRKAGCPRSLSMRVGASTYEVPTILARRFGQKDFFVGLDAETLVDQEEQDTELIDNVYEISGQERSVQSGGDTLMPWEILAAFLKGILKYLGVMDLPNNTENLAVTCPSLTPVRIKNLFRALEELGFGRKISQLMDYRESFYYYVMAQNPDHLNRSVAWYDFEGTRVVFRKLSMNGNTRPILAGLSSPAETRLTGEGREKDQEYVKFIQQTLGKEMYSSIQISGEGFDPEWAKESVKLLCYQRRKVFYGNNLYASGACSAGKERQEDHNLKAFCFLSEGMIRYDVGMDMRVMGSNAYYPLIEGGRNWYECTGGCELILDEAEELVFVVTPLSGNGKRRVSMQLPGLPVRPPKTTRLSLSLTFTGPEECLVVVKDLGFGDLFPSSGRSWRETVNWQGGDES